MVNKRQLAKLFKQNLPFFTALGDPVRQTLLLAMFDGVPRSVAELTGLTDLTRPSVSHHLKILKDAGIVSVQHQGRESHYYPKPGRSYERLKQLITAIDMAIQNEKERR